MTMLTSAALGLTRRMFLEQLGGVGGTALMLAGMDALGFGIQSGPAAPAPRGGGGGKEGGGAAQAGGRARHEGRGARYGYGRTDRGL